MEAGRIRTPRREGIQNNAETVGTVKDEPGWLSSIYVHSLSGAAIPLSHIATPLFRKSPTLIQHYNRERSITVASSVRRVKYRSYCQQNNIRNKKTEAPEGYRSFLQVR
jgi:multidrug efflux pump subunit AcrB